EVERPGTDAMLTMDVTPTFDPTLRMKSIGVSWESSTQLMGVTRGVDEAALVRQFERAGLEGVRPGMRVVSYGETAVTPVAAWRERPVEVISGLRRALEGAAGAPVPVTFEDDAGGRVTVDVVARAEYQVAQGDLDGEQSGFEHLLGLTPPMSVAQVDEPGAKAGLQAGDVFARIGEREWPSILDGISEIRKHRGRDIQLELMRGGELIELTAPVGVQGRIGFRPDQAFDGPYVASLPETDADLAIKRMVPGVTAGSRLVSLDGVPVADFDALRRALLAATADAARSGDGATVELALGLGASLGDGDAPVELRAWELSPEDVAALHALSWDTTLLAAQFTQAEVLMRASGPVDAVVLGVQKTHRIMMLTYLTFQRLWQGTVRVDQLKGPVGIAHIGAQVADRGLIHLLFFLGLISVNLAVINFLPVPVVDGGLFVMLLIEGVTGKPVPIVVQNIATMIGLALILSVFVIVTINDLRALFF
ncbi:MAG: site-2 protease family protein, partial [Planctomycetota bacterium]